MKLFRSGIFEYDKRQVKAVRPCLECGQPMEVGTTKKVHSACYDQRLQRNLQAGRERRKAAKAAVQGER